MQLLLNLAWRNLFRNRRRTLLTVLVISIGLSCLMFQDALIRGLTRTMIQRATETFEGDGKIFARAFALAHEVEYTLPNQDQIDEALRAAPQVTHYAPRVETPAMLNSARETMAVTLYGVDPEREIFMSQISPGIISGQFLSPNASNEILLGADLAKQLNVKLGDRIVATLGQAGTGGLSQELFRLTGIFRVGEPYLDKAGAIVSLKDSQRLLAIDSKIHYYVLKFANPELASSPTETLWQRLSSPEVAAENWLTLFPQLTHILQLIRVVTGIATGLLFGLIIFIIVNTLLMSLFERLTELGVLRALGTRPRAMAALIMLEALLLGIVSTLCGAVLGLLVIFFFNHHGIDYGGVDVVGVSINAIYPLFAWHQVIVLPILLIAITLFAGLYPAYTAASILPIRAMRKQWR